MIAVDMEVRAAVADAAIRTVLLQPRKKDTKVVGCTLAVVLLTWRHKAIHVECRRISSRRTHDLKTD